MLMTGWRNWLGLFLAVVALYSISIGALFALVEIAKVVG